MHWFLLILFFSFTNISAELVIEKGNIESFIEQRKYVLKKKFSPHYHINAPVGRLNDPSGFIYFQDRYHIFYQYHPLGSSNGPTHWGHVVSTNLVDWYHYPTALTPREDYERDGCLSGSAVIHNGYLTLFYTGNVIKNNKTKQTINLAITSDGILFQKYIYNPIISVLPTGKGDFRHPKVWKARHTWYMIVGTTTKKNRGCIVLYTSTDLFHWNYNGTLAESLGDMGFMWENPDLFEIEGYHVLILSVQGLVADGFQYRNIYQTGYIVTRFNYGSQRFEDFELSTATFNELDYGHDFYGAQSTKAHDGRQLLVAWLGIWESNYDDNKDGFSSQMTMIRDLRISSTGKLLMLPVKEYVYLRKEMLEDAWYSPGEGFLAGAKSYELILNATTTYYDVIVSLEWDDEKQFIISYHAERNYISIDRGGVDGVRRAPWAPVGHLHWRIFVDASSIEVYCGHGEVVFSSRIFPKKDVRIRIDGETQIHVVQYKMRKSVRYDKALRKLLLNTVEHNREGDTLFHKFHSNKKIKRSFSRFSNHSHHSKEKTVKVRHQYSNEILS